MIEIDTSRLSAQALFIDREKEIIAEHASELTIRRKQLTHNSADGAVDVSRWIQEVEFFIDQILEPQVNGIRNCPKRRERLRNLIDAATLHYLSSRVCFSLDRMPIPFEQAVSNSLIDLGWHTETVYVNNEDRASLMAEMRGERIFIHCRRYALCVGALAIETARQRQVASGASNVVIVSDGKFTDRARQLATSRSVILLHHNRLMQLEERLFGTDAWRQIPPRTVQSEVVDAFSFGPWVTVPNAA